MAKAKLTRSHFLNAATVLGCDIAMIQAVAKVESLGGGFLADGQPKILFERHWFHRFTRGRFDRTYPGISSLSPGGYKGGVAEHARLEQAALLDREAALMSTSWGMFQIMGFNFAACGFDTLQGFINAMYAGEPSQLGAFVEFIKSQHLVDELIRKDFAGFARGYNGPNYAINKYDTKIRDAYLSFGGTL